MKAEARQKISVAIPQLTGGGAEKITTRLVARLSADERLSRLYTGSAVGAERMPGVELVDLEAPRALQAIPKFLRRVVEDTAEAFLLTLGYVNLAPLIRLRRRRARIVLRIGNTVTPEVVTLPWHARIRYLGSLRLAVGAADAVVVQSYYMGRDLVRHIPAVESKLRVIHNFVEKELWSWEPPETAPIDQPYLFCAASMKPQKGFDLLLAAFAASQRRFSTRLVVAGVHPANSAFSQLMRENGLEEREVVRLGFVAEPYAWMAHAEACVLASRFEGFSNFLLEAAALGKRIVATDCPGGNAELFAHYRNAEVVPLNNSRSLASALDAPRRDLDRAESRKFLQPFDEDETYNCYVDVLTGRRGAGSATALGAA